MFRFELIEDISRKVEEIQDESLQEYEIRQRNDKINELLREKEDWEQRIIELGGPDYQRLEPSKELITKDIPQKNGYRYFGKARELMGVQHLLQAQKEFEDLQNQVEDIPIMPVEYYLSEDEKKLAVEMELNSLKSLDTTQGNLFGIYPQDVHHLQSLPDNSAIEQVLVRLKKQEVLRHL